MTRPKGSKNIKEEIPPKPTLSDNCGCCLHCTDKNFDKRQEKENPAKCPVCGSDRAQIAIFRNPCNNWVICPNGHRYDILKLCDMAGDIRLHQNTILTKQKVWQTKYMD